MSDTYTTPGAQIDNLCLDLYVSAVCATQGRLNTKAADGVATRLRSAAADMIYPDDAEMLRSAAERLETLTTRVKALTGRPRVKTAPRPAPGPSIAERISQETEERMASAGPFDRTTFEDVERARIAEMNRQLAEANRRAEELRRR